MDQERRQLNRGQAQDRVQDQMQISKRGVLDSETPHLLELALAELPKMPQM